MDLIGPDGIASCFTSSYGREYLRSGSYLRRGPTVRRFSPAEIARLLHLPGSFEFPPHMEFGLRYRLLGNSVNVAVARELLKHFDFDRITRG